MSISSRAMLVNAHHFGSDADFFISGNGGYIWFKNCLNLGISPYTALNRLDDLRTKGAAPNLTSRTFKKLAGDFLKLAVDDHAASYSGEDRRLKRVESFLSFRDEYDGKWDIQTKLTPQIGIKLALDGMPLASDESHLSLIKAICGKDKVTKEAVALNLLLSGNLTVLKSVSEKMRFNISLGNGWLGRLKSDLVSIHKHDELLPNLAKHKLVKMLIEQESCTAVNTFNEILNAAKKFKEVNHGKSVAEFEPFVKRECASEVLNEIAIQTINYKTLSVLSDEAKLFPRLVNLAVSKGVDFYDSFLICAYGPFGAIDKRREGRMSPEQIGEVLLDKFMMHSGHDIRDLMPMLSQDV